MKLEKRNERFGMIYRSGKLRDIEISRKFKNNDVDLFDKKPDFSLSPSLGERNFLPRVSFFALGNKWRLEVLPKLPKRTFESDPGVQISGYFGFKPINRGIGLPLRVDRDTKHNESGVKKKRMLDERARLLVHGETSSEIREARDKKRCRKKKKRKRDILNLDLASEKVQSSNFNKHASRRERNMQCRNSLLKFKYIR